MTTPSEQRPNPPTAKPADKGPTPAVSKGTQSPIPESPSGQKPAAQEALHLAPQKDGPSPSTPAADAATPPPATKGNSSIPAQKE